MIINLKIHFVKKYLFIALLFPFVAFSQQKYFTYQYNSLYGITDANGADVVKPQYPHLDDRYSDSLIILENFAGKTKTLVFNIFTGKKQEYDKIEKRHIYIQNEFYSLIENDKKQYLLGQKSGFVINLKEFYHTFQNLGSDYIVAKSNRKKTINLVLDDKTQAKTENDVYHIFKNNRKLSIIKEIAVKENFTYQIYKEKLPEKTDNIVQLIDNQVVLNFPNEKFDYIAIFQYDYVRKLDYWELYDKNWVLIKKMYPKDSDSNMQEFVTKAVQLSVKGKKNVIIEHLRNEVYPDMATEEGRNFLMIDTKNGVDFVNYLKNDNYFFLFKTTSKVSSSYNRVTLEDAKNNKIVVDVDENSFKMYLPTQYQQQFKISFEK